ncbi:BTB/POZ domain-containing protein [Ditylenchus destructor]|uniref:BTB/POZ domain-containing protein n=1 Tax=Ditylenchus destructor TaxID=166010 RepID=A0AAD4QWT2_9BILA|nr:BTB/POZ domain-containing protein [Ditylenchus destructor]
MSDSADFENDYTDIVIVAENEWHSTTQERVTVCIYNSLWEIKEELDPVSGNKTIDRVFCQKLLPERENCHAEVLFISDNTLVNKVRQKFTTDEEDDSGVAIGEDYHHSVVIRILEDKQKILKEFDNRSAADVTFVVNGEECKADRKWMATASPVFNAMLYGQFAEGKQDKIVLEEIESIGIFKDFLLAVSPLRIQPNPSNVVALLKLAHQYDIPFLMRNCEDHLMLCYEISIADRILLAGKYGLDSLRMRTMQQLSDFELQEILKDKSDQLREPESNFLFHIIADRIEEQRINVQNLEKKLQEAKKTQKK